MPPSARSEELLWGAGRGCSPAPIAAVSVPRSCSRSYRLASSTTLILRPGLQTCSHVSPITRSPTSRRCCHGTGRASVGWLTPPEPEGGASSGFPRLNAAPDLVVARWLRRMAVATPVEQGHNPIPVHQEGSSPCVLI